MTLYTRLDVLLLNMWSRVGLALPEGGNVDDAPVRDSSAAYEQAGIYAQSFRLLDAALIFTTLLSTQLLPMFAKRMANQESSDDLLKWSTRGIVVVGLVGVGIVWFVGEEILTRLYPGLYGSAAELHNASVVFGLLMSSFLPMALVHVYGTYVTAAGELKWLSGLSAAGLLLNLALNGYYIPLVGAAGAALSCLATQTFFALGCWYKSRELRGLSVLG
jgi:O-antigen/teichoic acid export membrane protein